MSISARDRMVVFAWISLAAVGGIVVIQPHFVAAVGTVHKPT